MPKQFIKSALSVIIAIGMSNIAAAETPPEVAESYQSYKSAVLSLNQEKAEQSALAAWKAAEESLGDARVTGDLAQNYADIAIVSKSNYRKIQRAYRRSIELASYYPDDEALTVRIFGQDATNVGEAIELDYDNQVAFAFDVDNQRIAI